MASARVIAAESGIRGETWELDVVSLTLGGESVSSVALASATVTGTIGGVAVSSAASDPVDGVRLRVTVDADVTADAVAQDAPYLSDVRVEFSDGTVKKLRLYFTVLESPTE